MINKDKRKYFTAGELAAIFNISKQSLLYYDKVNLLSPDFVSENGYRNYSIQQFLDLEIIVNLRALDISIANIKKYLEDRSKEHFLQLLQKKNRGMSGHHPQQSGNLRHHRTHQGGYARQGA